MKILRGFTYCMRTMLLGLCVAALSQIAAAQIWIASTGSVDESSVATYQFDGQLAFVRPSIAKGTVTLRYNVVPAGDLLTQLAPCCEAFGG